MIEHEPVIRLGAYAGSLAVLLLVEHLWPRRTPATSQLPRRITNLAMVAVDTAFVRLVLPVAAVGWAVQVQARGWGFLNQVDGPAWLEGVIAFVLLDLAIFLQHLAAHHATWLWRLHRMHHSDLEFDASTGVRFHPFEIVLSMLWKMVVVTLLGASAAAVLVFEVVLSTTSLWEHTNVRLPEKWDRRLRLWLVTPDMHRVHHSWHPAETNSNYGFNFSWWDRLFRTYTGQPRDGHTAMTIGIRQFREPRHQGLIALVLQPFRRD